VKILVEGEEPAEAINVTGGQQSRVIDITTGTVFAVNGQTGNVQLRGLTGWINAADAPYSAARDGIGDPTAAIQAAIDAVPAGGIVYLPPGVYAVTDTIDLKNGVSLRSDRASLMVGPGMTGNEYPCYIQPAASFAGASVIQIIGDADGTHPSISGEQHLTNLMIDGSKLGGSSIDGLYARGNVQNVVLDNVTIKNMPNNGIVTASRTDGTFPFSWRLRHVMLDNCHANGLLLTNCTDLTLDDVQAIGCWGQGFVLDNCTNSRAIDCRAEWNGSHGYHLTGNWGSAAGSGGMQLVGCSTDRNGQHGVLVDATGNTPIAIAALQLRRDGSNGGSGGGGYAGLAVINATVPIVVDAVTCYPGVDDGGGSTNSPQYGARFAGATYVSVASGFLWGATAGWSDGGSNAVLRRGPNIGERTGTTGSPTDVFTQPWTSAGAITAPSFNTDGTVRSGNFRTNSDTEHALTVYQRATGTSPGSVALNVISDKPGDSAMWLTGHETARGTFKVAHLNGGASATADSGAAAISIDLQWNGKGGTAAQGIFLTATEGATTGNLITLRNAASPTVEEFCVRGSGLSGFQLPVGNTPQGTLEIRQKDINTIAQVVQGVASSAVPIAQFKNSGGTATFEIGASGAIVTRATAFVTGAMQLGSTSSDLGGSGGAVISMKNATTAPTTNPTGGAILFTAGGYFKSRAADGNVFDTTRRTVTGSRGGNAALASLLTQLASTGLITDSSSA
jgi:hypothetical protein